jgi:DNA mismatch repair protein MutS2
LAVDLDRDSREALEFDSLLDWIAGLTRTALGAARIRTLVPRSDPAAVADELAHVEEVARYVDREGALVPGALPDPRPALASLGIAELGLTPEPLRDLAVFGLAAAELGAHLRVLEGDVFPRLGALGRALPDLRGLCRTVSEGIAPDGRLEASASAELRRIRAAIARTGERLRKMLTEILHDPDSEALIQDEFITQRNGRYVIPIRTDAPRPVRGIVHAASSSGATRFVEPIGSVELNNELVSLAEEEREECERILRRWSDAFRERRREVGSLVETLARIDDLEARARFARATRAVTPRVAPGGALRLGAARHPLLERHLGETGQVSVPLDLELDPAWQVLVISGPNTGGKTVALKTVGLAVLMAQSGIPVPARSAELPLYRQVRADIGDKQSIESDLSTYSAHVQAMVGILAERSEPALILMDEIGTGTEPTEGAALAQAILEALGTDGVTAVATTHLAPLKAWALEREGARSAAMEFDATSLRPTYRLLADTPGTSAALEIAERLGLDPRIVARARELLDPHARQGEAYVKRLRELLSAAELERDRVREERASLEDERVRLQVRHEGERERLARESSLALERALDELREAGRRELRALEERRERARQEKHWSRAESRLEALARLPTLTRATEGGGRLAPDEIRPGMRVLVASLGREGEVADRRADGRVDVRLGAMSVTVDPAELRAPAAGGAPATRPTARPRAGGAAAPPERSASRELILIGRTVEEAEAEVDRFLDAALIAGHEEVRVVHGHGTGRLRTAIRRFLAGHAQVAGQRPGRPEEGGDGATVVTLR